MSDDESRSDDGSALDDVSDEEIEELEEGVDTEGLDEDERVTLDDAARALLAKPRRGHGPIARLYRGRDEVRLRRASTHLVRDLHGHHRARDRLDHPARRTEPGH